MFNLSKRNCKVINFSTKTLFSRENFGTLIVHFSTIKRTIIFFTFKTSQKKLQSICDLRGITQAMESWPILSSYEEQNCFLDMHKLVLNIRSTTHSQEPHVELAIKHTRLQTVCYKDNCFCCDGESSCCIPLHKIARSIIGTKSLQCNPEMQRWKTGHITIALQLIQMMHMQLIFNNIIIKTVDRDRQCWPCT